LGGKSVDPSEGPGHRSTNRELELPSPREDIRSDLVLPPQRVPIEILLCGKKRSQFTCWSSTSSTVSSRTAERGIRGMNKKDKNLFLSIRGRQYSGVAEVVAVLHVCENEMSRDESWLWVSLLETNRGSSEISQNASGKRNEMIEAACAKGGGRVSELRGRLQSGLHRSR